MIEKMERTYVVSSNIRTIGYENGNLEIEFKNTSIYRYLAVPEHIFTELMKAPSKRKYFHRFIEPKYKHFKVR
jgi:hypothetical protein